MKVLTKVELEELMLQYPEGGVVFCEYRPNIYGTKIMVTDNDGVSCNGATDVLPWEGDVFDWDWNIAEYSDNDLFAVFDNNDIMQMIQTLARGLKIKLEYENRYF